MDLDRCRRTLLRAHLYARRIGSGIPLGTALTLLISVIFRTNDFPTTRGADEVLGRLLRKFVHADDWAGVCARLRQVESRGKRPDQAERIVLMPGGAFTSDSRSFIDWVSNPVLRKPVDVEALEAAIAEVVRASDHD